MSKVDLYRDECVVICRCGSKQGEHALGNEKCFRELVLKSEEPKPFGVEKILWKLPKQVHINGFTLMQQRGYSFHEKSKRWSKPKNRGKDWFESKGWD